MRSGVKVTIKKNNLDKIGKNVGSAIRDGINDVGDDLVRASSGATPFDKGTLSQSWNKNISVSRLQAIAEVSYSVHNRGFNYAIKMHEGSYNLGPGSRSKPGGQGMSGKRYSVGPKFLERPLLGEQQAYKDHIKEMIQKSIKGLS